MASHLSALSALRCLQWSSRGFINKIEIRIEWFCGYIFYLRQIVAKLNIYIYFMKFMLHILILIMNLWLSQQQPLEGNCVPWLCDYAAISISGRRRWPDNINLGETQNSLISCFSRRKQIFLLSRLFWFFNLIPIMNWSSFPLPSFMMLTFDNNISGCAKCMIIKFPICKIWTHSNSWIFIAIQTV